MPHLNLFQLFQVRIACVEAAVSFWLIAFFWAIVTCTGCQPARERNFPSIFSLLVASGYGGRIATGSLYDLARRHDLRLSILNLESQGLSENTTASLHHIPTRAIRGDDGEYHMVFLGGAELDVNRYLSYLEQLARDSTLALIGQGITPTPHQIIEHMIRRPWDPRALDFHGSPIYATFENERTSGHHHTPDASRRLLASISRRGFDLQHRERAISLRLGPQNRGSTTSGQCGTAARQYGTSKHCVGEQKP
jgi:hypothetical protein